MKLKIRESAFQYVQTLNLPQNHHDKYIYFLSLLSHKNKNGFRKLNSVYLKAILGKNRKSLSYSQIISALTDNGVIECDNISIKGKKSLGYCLTENYLKGKVVDTEIRTKRIIQKIEVGSLKKWEVLPQYVRAMRENFAQLTLHGKYLGKTKISRSRTGRVYNFLTGNKRIIRPHLRYQGNELLVELDAKNFQPFLLGLIVCNGLNIQSWDEQMPLDLRHYLMLVKNGELYQHFAKKLNIDISIEMQKDKLKKKFFSGYFFNSDFVVLNKSDVGEIFKNDFPSIHGYILNNFVSKDKTLAYTLQIKESEMFIEGIYQSLQTKGLWAVTIHDSIVCKQTDLEFVKKEMENYFNQLVIPAKLEVKQWIVDEGGIHLDGYFGGDHYSNTETGEWGFINVVTFSEENSKVYTPPTPELEYFEDFGIVAKSKNDWLKLEKREIIWREVGECNFYQRPVTVKGIHKKTRINKATIREHLEEMKNRFVFDLISRVFTQEEHDELAMLEEDKYEFLDGELFLKYSQAEEIYLNNSAQVAPLNNKTGNQLLQLYAVEMKVDEPGIFMGRIRTETGTDYFGSCAKKNKEPKPLTKDKMEWAASINWDELFKEEQEPVESKAEELIEEYPLLTADMFEI